MTKDSSVFTSNSNSLTMWVPKLFLTSQYSHSMEALISIHVLNKVRKMLIKITCFHTWIFKLLNGIIWVHLILKSIPKFSYFQVWAKYPLMSTIKPIVLDIGFFFFSSGRKHPTQSHVILTQGLIDISLVLALTKHYTITIVWF
jgi:hypothetical protein